MVQMDFDLAAFHSLVKLLKRTLRQLGEAALASLLIKVGQKKGKGRDGKGLGGGLAVPVPLGVVFIIDVVRGAMRSGCCPSFQCVA